MTRLACKYCIATRGLKGSEIGGLPKTEAELIDHIERDHHIPVRRAKETTAECKKRFTREQPEAYGPNCKCPACEKDRSWELDLQKRCLAKKPKSGKMKR